MAGRRPGCGLERGRPRRAVRGGRVAREVACAGTRRIRRAGGRRRARVRPGLPGDGGQPDHGRHGAAGGARRADRRRALGAGVAGHLPQPPVEVRDRTAGHAGGRRRSGLRPRRGRDAALLRHRHGRPCLAGRHDRGLRRHRARLRCVAVAARRGGPLDRPAGRRAGCEGGRVRQGDRRGSVARAGRDVRGRLFVAHRHRRRRRAAADRLARRGHHVAQSGDRRRLLEPGLPERRRGWRLRRRYGAGATSSSASSTTA